MNHSGNGTQTLAAAFSQPMQPEDRQCKVCQAAIVGMVAGVLRSLRGGNTCSRVRNHVMTVLPTSSSKSTYYLNTSITDQKYYAA